MKYVYVFLALMVNSQLFGQLYFCGSGGEMGVLDLEDCSYELRSDRFGNTLRLGSFLDIALHPDGRLFAIDAIDEGSILVEIDWSNFETSDTLAFISEKDCNALVCSEDGILYMGFRQLHSYNLMTGTFTTHGSFPGGRRLLGDLLFMNGDLIGASGNGLVGAYFHGLLYKININTPEESELLMTLPSEVGMVGLATVCNSGGSKFIGSDREEKDSYIIEIKIGQNKIDTLCFIDLPFDKYIAGLTSADEFRQNCRLRLDLDRNNSSGRLIDHYYADSFCVVDFPIGDEDLVIQSAYEKIDSFAITVVGGVLSPEEEFLVSEGVPGLRVIGEGTDRLLVVNEGDVGNGEIEQFLRGVRFQIGAAAPQTGERILHTVLYAEGTASDIAKSFISVTIGEPPSAGEDTHVEVCYGEFRVDLFEAIGGNPRPGGRWEPSLYDGGNRFYALKDTSGIYRYIVQEGGCGADTALVEVLVHEEPPIGLGPEGQLVSVISACPGDTILWDISLPDAFTYWWLDGTQGPVATITAEGVYAGEVGETNGCFWYTKTFVDYVEPEQTIETIRRCEGEVFLWQGEAYTQDTVLCAPMIDSQGCEGQHCVEVRFAAPVVQYETRYFCRGSHPVVEGVAIERDTSFCLPLSGPDCGTIRCITALFKPLAQGFERVELCEGESYWFGNQWLSSAGTYSTPMIAADGCDSIAHLELVIHPRFEQTIDTLITTGTSLQVGNMSFEEAGAYSIGLSTVAGCDSLVYLQLAVQATQYYAPGMIRPNGSGWGQVFTIYTRHQQPATIRRLTIFNTWGQPLFEKENLMAGSESQAWKGTNNGHAKVPAGVYFYQAEVEDIAGKREMLKGKVVVVY
ncbi:MAG: gliding motility-associated C-terminal domain-containing protein [Saprospiraceae bacterium]